MPFAASSACFWIETTNLRPAPTSSWQTARRRSGLRGKVLAAQYLDIGPRRRKGGGWPNWPDLEGSADFRPAFPIWLAAEGGGAAPAAFSTAPSSPLLIGDLQLI